MGFAFVDRPDTFGVSQLRHLWPPSAITVTAVLLTLAALALGFVAARPLPNRTLDEVLLAAIAVGSYWVFRHLDDQAVGENQPRSQYPPIAAYS